MDTKNLTQKIQSNQFRRVLVCILIGLLTVFVFTLGMQVGFMKASFTYHGGDNYYRTFGPSDGHHAGIDEESAFSDAHGVSGKIVSINLPTIMVADRDNTEKTIVLGKDTVVRKLRDTIIETDLIVGDYVVVIGEPSDTRGIEAKFIRVLPPPPQENTNMETPISLPEK